MDVWITVHHRFLLEAEHVFHPLCCALSVVPPQELVRAALVSCEFDVLPCCCCCCRLLPVMVAIVLLPFLNFATLVVASVDDGKSFRLRLSSIAIPFAHFCCIGVCSFSSLSLSVSLSLGFSSLPPFSLSLFLTSTFLVYYVLHFFPLPQIGCQEDRIQCSILVTFFLHHAASWQVPLTHVHPTHLTNDQ